MLWSTCVASLPRRVTTGDPAEPGGCNPPEAWRWHGPTPNSAETWVTFGAPNDFDLNVNRRHSDAGYKQNPSN